MASTGARAIVSESGTLSNTSQQNYAGISTTTFTTSAGYNGNVVLSLTTNDPTGPCGAASDMRTIQITPLVVTSPIGHD